MLTPELSARFKILSAPIDSLPGGYFSEDELDGFMYALVLTHQKSPAIKK